MRNSKYKIISVAGSNDLQELREVWSFIHQAIPSGKISASKLVRILRMTSRVHIDNKGMGGMTDEDNDDSTTDDCDRDLYHSDERNNIDIEDITSHEGFTNSQEGAYVERDKVFNDFHDETFSNSNENNDFKDSNEAIHNGSGKRGVTDEDSTDEIPANISNTNLNADFDFSMITRWGIDDFLITYLAALLPPPLPLPGKKESMNCTKSFQIIHFLDIKESHLVKKRQRLLVMLSASILLIRFCSFDFFICLFISLNLALIYVLRNSKKINIALAKRTVKTRVGWAKQYFGGLIHRTPTTTVIPNTIPIILEPKSSRMKLLSKLKRKSKTNVDGLLVTDNDVKHGSGEESVVEESQRRIGLFRRGVSSKTALGSSIGISPLKSLPSP